ncbi:MAG: class F sortase [Dehalococcoidia bacterium]|nr:class F sortase [Dehalococcoidia bacterium]
MRLRALFAALVLAGGIAGTATWLVPGPGAAAEVASRPPALGEQLRYIGRDPWTGAPAPVNDRFIAEVERAIERYGKDESEAVPAPPATGADVSRLAIPAIGVDAPVARYGLDRYGRLDIPQDTTTIGWNPGFSSLPGESEATFFAAHFEYQGRPGVFNRLSTLAPGAEIVVALSDGATHRYRVTSVVDYHLASIDMGALLAGREGVESITLMTCSGAPTTEGYEYRTVVLAERTE